MANTTIEKWGIFELSLTGNTNGNPFRDYEIHGTFTCENESVTVSGFYDGDGIYKIRFMPSYEGTYHYEISGTFSGSTATGTFQATAPTGSNHGPVQVSHTFHLAYADHTPHFSVGTTCYTFDLQDPSIVEQTFAELEKGYFNKLRFCIMPKHYDFCLHDPCAFPYEGTPMDASRLTRENFMEYTGKTEGNQWDFTRFCPEFFRIHDRTIERLMQLGIEADLILFHPYDRWGFSKMSMEDNLRYLKYITARYSAYRNVWWSMANEYDLMPHLAVSDWEQMAAALVENDPYHHLRSIHNCETFYDHTKPWITHCSCQRCDLYKTTETTTQLRETYGKPVIWDEVGYEGNLPHCWGNLTAEELTRRSWEAAIRGGYCGHSETYLSKDNLIWWCHGNTLKGESAKRFGFLMDFLKDVPGCGLKEGQLRDNIHFQWDDNIAVPQDDQYAGTWYFYYFSLWRPSFRQIYIDDTTWYDAEIIDTWNMEITPAGRHKGKYELELPGRQYMGIRLKKSADQGDRG